VTNQGFSRDAAGGFLPSTGGYQAQQLVGYVRRQEGRYPYSEPECSRVLTGIMT
jgi:hypothetical protein